MRLRLTPASPYARRVRVTAAELGLAERLTLIDTALRTADAGFWADNPLGRVPTLDTGEGLVLVDSHVICEWLAAGAGAAGEALLPAAGPGRWQALSLAAIASGVVEAAVMVRRERQRPDGEADAAVLAYEGGKVARGLERLERDIAAPMLAGARAFDHAAIAAACAIGWLEFRLGADFAFAGRPALQRWWQDLVQPRASMQATTPR